MSVFKTIFGGRRSSKSTRQDVEESKYCVGDFVELLVEGKKFKGIIKFVGVCYFMGPEEMQTVRYGIDCQESVPDGHNGQPTSFDRKYFECKDNHGIFVLREEIIRIIRKMPAPIRITVNDIVSVQHRGKGVVLFVGPVLKTKGIWYGVELFAKQGKHDGVINAHKYFSCAGEHGVHVRYEALSLGSAELGKVRSVPSKSGETPDATGRVRKGSQAESYTKIDIPSQLRYTSSRDILGQERGSKQKETFQERKEKYQRIGIGEMQILGVADMKATAYKSDAARRFKQFYECDEIHDALGEGAFGAVYLCRLKELKKGEKHRRTYAVKKIPKSKMHHLPPTVRNELIDRLSKEIQLLKKMRRQKRKKLHGYKHIVHFIDAFEDRNYLYLITNLCKGGDLWSWIKKQEEVTERDARVIMKQVLEGLLFLQHYDIAHMDLKPENIMFVKSKTGQDIVQLIDFGMARVIPRLKQARKLAGSPHFVAPEVLNGNYDTKADVWSCGVILFLLLYGYPPFFDGESALGDDEKIYSRIRDGFHAERRKGHGPWFPLEVTHRSQEARELIAWMLQTDLTKRYTVKECLDHKWFRKDAIDGKAADTKQVQKLDHTVHDALINFSRQCKFKVLIAQIFSSKVSRAEIRRLKEVLAELDKNGDGKITFDEFRKGMKQLGMGYSDEQLDVIFNAVDVDGNRELDFDELLTAYSYQKLVAADERLYQAFSDLDQDGTGYITKGDLIDKVKSLVDVDDAVKSKALKMLGDASAGAPSASKKRHTLKLRTAAEIEKSVSDALAWADLDMNGKIDQEEFLRSLHPVMNETLVPEIHRVKTPTTTVTYTFQRTDTASKMPLSPRGPPMKTTWSVEPEDGDKSDDEETDSEAGDDDEETEDELSDTSSAYESKPIFDL